MQNLRKTLVTLATVLSLLTAFSAPLMANEQEVQLIPFKGYDLNGKPVDVAQNIGNHFKASANCRCRYEHKEMRVAPTESTLAMMMQRVTGRHQEVHPPQTKHQQRTAQSH